MVRVFAAHEANLANDHSRQRYELSRLEQANLKKKLSKSTSSIATKEVEVMSGPVSCSCMV